MNISDMKKMNSLASWDAIVQRDPQLQLTENVRFWKKTRRRLYWSGYEKGINDAQTQKTSSMAASR